MIENNVVGSYSRLGGQARRSRELGLQSRRSQTYEKAGEGESKAEGMQRAQRSCSVSCSRAGTKAHEGARQVLMAHGS